MLRDPEFIAKYSEDPELQQEEEKTTGEFKFYG
jgi:hypothetical protein